MKLDVRKPICDAFEIEPLPAQQAIPNCAIAALITWW